MTREKTNTPDLNSLVAAELREMAFVQTVREKKSAYMRAALTVFGLEQPLDALVRAAGGTMPKIPNIGPSSLKVIQEVMKNGRSTTVEQAVAASPKAADIARRRALLEGFMSRAQVLAVLNDSRQGGLSPKDYRGDLQMHSQWSDGSETLAELADGCLARGYEYCAVTDHSQGLQIAGGMTMADVARQHKEIDATNRTLKGRFKIIKGVEANILPNGELDLTAEDRRSFEIVLAAPHAALRDAADQTARMLTAVRLPGVHILAHPRGRKIGERAGVTADWDRVFAEAAKRNVAIEIDGDPSRQDVDHTLVPRAVKAGCLIALDSDAHSTGELRYAETAIAHAKLAKVPKERIVNYWPLETLLSWSKDHT